MPGDVRAVVLSGVLTHLSAALKFMMTEGTFWQHQGHWDGDRDGVITAAEFEADPRGIRKQLPPGFPFSTFDASGDGRYTVEDARARGKALTDAVDSRNVAGVMPWLKASAGLEIPEGWLADHFAHAPIDTFLQQLQIPVGHLPGGRGPVDAGKRGARAGDPDEERREVQHGVSVFPWPRSFVRRPSVLPPRHTVERLSRAVRVGGQADGPLIQTYIGRCSRSAIQPRAMR
jgi:hypothetical protein